MVGQINRDKKSAQLSFPLLDGSVGEEFKKIIDQCCKTYMQQGYGQDVTADAFELGQFIVMLVTTIHCTIMVVELKQDFQ